MNPSFLREQDHDREARRIIAGADERFFDPHAEENMHSHWSEHFRYGVVKVKRKSRFIEKQE